MITVVRVTFCLVSSQAIVNVFFLTIIYELCFFLSTFLMGQRYRHNHDTIQVFFLNTAILQILPADVRVRVFACAFNSNVRVHARIGVGIVVGQSYY